MCVVWKKLTPWECCIFRSFWHILANPSQHQYPFTEDVTDSWSNCEKSQIKSSTILWSNFALNDCPRIFFLSRLYIASSIDDLHFMYYSFILSEGCDLICYIFREKNQFKCNSCNSVFFYHGNWRRKRKRDKTNMHSKVTLNVFTT